MTDKSIEMELIGNSEQELPIRVPVVDPEIEAAQIPRKIDYYHFPNITSDVIQDIALNKRIAFTGHTGTGKTSLPQQIAARINQPVLRVNLNGQTTISDFVGFWMASGGEMIWVDGTLPLALRNGYWLILDEIDYAEPFALAVLNAVLEMDGTLELKEKGHELVIPHPDTRIFATGNTIGAMSEYRGLYQGTNLLNEAFVDRWMVYQLKYLSPADEAEIVAKAVPKMNVKITVTLVNVANMVREAFEKGEVNCTFSLRRLVDWAEMMIRHRNPLLAAENTIFSKISKDDVETIKGIIQRVTKVAT